ncbi:hypothetical protein D3C84_349730 [compost metagenome]
MNKIKIKRNGSGRQFFKDDQIIEIRNKLKNGSKTIDVANEYKVNVDVIYNIKAGKTYKHVHGGDSLILR